MAVTAYCNLILKFNKSVIKNAFTIHDCRYLNPFVFKKLSLKNAIFFENLFFCGTAHHIFTNMMIWWSQMYLKCKKGRKTYFEFNAVIICTSGSILILINSNYLFISSIKIKGLPNNFL